MIRIVLVEDESLVRAGMVELLSLNPEYEVAGVAVNGEEAVALIRERRPDVVLMDIRMPVLDGPGALQRLADEGVETRAILITTFDDDEALVRGMRAGARGYLRKDTSLEQLNEAIRSVLAGETVFRPAVTDRGLARLRRIQPAFESSEYPEPLTARETEVLRLMAAGLSNREIADLLGNSEGTVKTHVSTIMGKLGVRDRTRAVLKGLELGLI